MTLIKIGSRISSEDSSLSAINLSRASTHIYQNKTSPGDINHLALVLNRVISRTYKDLESCHTNKHVPTTSALEQDMSHCFEGPLLVS